MSSSPPEPPAARALTASDIRAALTTRLFGNQVRAYPKVASTNDLARNAAMAGAAEGLLIVADEQEAGRGRRGRTWLAPAGGAILASLLLRPHAPLGEAFAPTMILALAVQHAAHAWGVPAVLKWPNDVLVGGRKLAGILAEASLSAETFEYVVVGFGVNVAFDPAGLGLGDTATSLSVELGGAAPDRAVVLARILAEAEARYLLWQAGDYATLWSEWRAALATLGGPVRVELGAGDILSGTAVDVERDGALIVAGPGGVVRRVVAGTVLG